MYFIVFFVIIFIVLVAASLILYARWNYGFLESLGIPVEPTTFCLGSCPDFYKKCAQYEDIKRFQKYGSVFGVYEGRSPQVFILDPELLKRIWVRDYDYFQDRTAINFGHDIPSELLDFMPEEKWKTVRKLLTAQLTSSRLKRLATVALDISDEFTNDLLKECTGDRMKVDFRNRVAPMLLDLAANGLYGFHVTDRKDPNNLFVQVVKSFLCENDMYDFRYTLILAFPFLKRLFPSWPFPAKGLKPFRVLMNNYFKFRQNLGQKYNDLGDVFLTMMESVNSKEYQRLGLNENSALAQIVEVLFGSFDSTGTAITMTVYFLSQHPEIQDKVLEEVDRIWDKYDGVLALEAIPELIYLTACLNESLRLAPPFARPERKCTKKWTGTRDNGAELTIPVGTNICIPIWALHRHPDYFPNPEKFDPERFMPENKKIVHPYAFAPFGHGPKNCIAIKLSYNNMIITLCRLLKDFKFEARSDTKLHFKGGTLLFVQYRPIYFDMVRRRH